MKLFRRKRTRGAISVFLILILLPTMLFSAVLIDGSRMASARAMTQEAADLAAASALAAYNLDLKEQYGLFAIEDPEKVEEIYKESLAATLMASGLSDDADYSERLWEILKSQLGAGNPYKGKQFLDLYDFSVDTCSVESLYSLANQDVLESQMVEHAKFRGIYVIADRLELLNHLGEIRSKAEKNSQTADVMQDKMQVDEDNGDVEERMRELREALAALQAGISALNRDVQSYRGTLQGEMESIRDEYTESDEEDTSSGNWNRNAYKNVKKALLSDLEAMDGLAGAVSKEAERAKKEVEQAISRLERFKSQNSQKASDNEEIGGMIADAEQSIKEYRDRYLPEIEELIHDPIINRLKDDKNLGKSMERATDDIDEAIRRYADELEAEEDDDEDDGDSEEEEEEETEYYFYYLSGSDRTEEIDDALEGRHLGSYMPAVIEIISYFCNTFWDDSGLNPSLTLAQEKSGASAGLSEDYAKEQSKKNEEAAEGGESGAQRGAVDQAVYQTLPSRNKSTAESGKNTGAGFYNTSGDLSASRAMLDGGKDSMLLDLAETARDDVLGLSYMFGTFKTRLTGVGKFSKEGMSESDKKSKYMPKWRYAHTGGELDMRFAPKKDHDTVLRGEIEYLIYGNRTDQANEDAVYATIYAERLLNNTIALYGERELINPSCHAAAATASVATAGIVPEPVFFWIFLMACAVAETYLDMNYLVAGGYRIPLFKTNKNVLLRAQLGDSKETEGLISNYGEPDWSFVSYEDYLLILLIVKGKEKRLMRTADLIEMNMKRTQSDFTMATAYTYLKADTGMSVRYLFGGIAPFSASYEAAGAAGRMRFKSTIYQGY